jgi:hypothetical protein
LSKIGFFRLALCGFFRLTRTLLEENYKIVRFVLENVEFSVRLEMPSETVTFSQDKAGTFQESRTRYSF